MTCLLCKGTGFANGKLCQCITGKGSGVFPEDAFSDQDVMDFFRGFRIKKEDKNDERD